MPEPFELAGALISRAYASLDGISLTPKKDGYKVTFHVDLADSDQVFALEAAIQRVIVLTVTKRPPRLRSFDTSDDGEGEGDHDLPRAPNESAPVDLALRRLPLAFRGS